MSSVIKLTKLGKDYNGFSAVNTINLEVKKGEVFGFIGPNGAGKTTTIKCLIGAIYPTRGNAYIEDYDVIHEPIKSQVNIGYISETTTSLYFDMDAITFVRYAGELKGLRRKQANENANKLLEILGLREFKKRKIGKMSTGMKQRINIAQALVNDPKILIGDEPTLGLDPVGKRDFSQLMLKLKSLGKSVFVSSHILDEVEKIVDTVAIINKGDITFNGSFSELQDTYRPDTFYLQVNDPEKLQTVLGKHSAKVIATTHYGTTIEEADNGKLKEILIDILNTGLDLREFRSTDSSLNKLFFDTVSSQDSQDSFNLDDLSLFAEEA